MPRLPYQLPPRTVTYNYRYFLPYAPEWGTVEQCRTRLRELLGFCQEARIDAVQFFVNTRLGTYYMPARSAAEQAGWARWMKDEVAPALSSAGISYQLNFQMLLGATTWGEFDLRDEYDWEFLVDQHGVESPGCACPNGPRFRAQMGEMLRLWAGTEPDILWIDDDFRLHNHSINQPEQDYYCFCSNHLAAFGQRTGKNWSREELVPELVCPGAPSPVRGQWLDFLGDTMVEAAAWVREQVQAVSPHTRLALMTSLPDVHSAEGRDWPRLLAALSGPHQPMTRPCCGVYTATNRAVKDNAVTFQLMEHSLIQLERTMGAGAVEYGPELENARFTTWAKSAANSRYVLTLAQLLGCPQITLSLNDLDGSPIDEEPTNAPLLKTTKPALQALAELGLRAWQPLGVAFLTDPESARKVHLGPGARLQDLHGARPWEEIIATSGIPARYVLPGEAGRDTGDVVVLDGFTAWLPSAADLERILAGGVLLDALAARVLAARGFGDLTGVEILGERMPYAAQSEIYHDNPLPGVPPCRVPHKGFNWYEMRLQGATLVSDFIDPRYGLHPGSAAFENRLGGRVVTYAHVGEFQPYAVFGNHGRLRWLRGAIQWLSRNQFPLLPLTRCHGLTMVRRQGAETVLAWANLSTDRVDELVFTAPEHPAGDALALAPDGTWQPCPVTATGEGKTYRVPCAVHALEWVVVRLHSVKL